MKKNRTTLGSKLNRPRGHIFGARWLGVPAKFVKARVVSVIVGDSTDEKYWAREYVGQQRSAVELRITGSDEVFYLDNEEDSTVWKLTSGGGDIKHGHKQLMIQRLVDDPSIAISYGYKAYDHFPKI